MMMLHSSEQFIDIICCTVTHTSILCTRHHIHCIHSRHRYSMMRMSFIASSHHSSSSSSSQSHRQYTVISFLLLFPVIRASNLHSAISTDNIACTIKPI